MVFRHRGLLTAAFPSRFLPWRRQIQGGNRSKVGHLARISNAEDAAFRVKRRGNQQPSTDPRQMPEELQPTKLEVAGSNPVSVVNDGRVAQGIERVTISPPLVAKVPPTGGCRQDYIVWKQRVRLPPPETAKSCQSSRPPFFAAWKNKCLGNYIGRRFESCPAFGG